MMPGFKSRLNQGSIQQNILIEKKFIYSYLILDKL